MKRLFIFVLLLAVAVLAIGFSRGWFTATPTEAGGKKGITFNWNLDKIKEDMGKAGSKIKAVSQSAMEKIKAKAKTINATTSEIEGKVKSVDAANHTVTIEADGHDVPLSVPEIDKMDQLVGKSVRVTLEKSGDTMVVTKITEK